jgi:hypothetical protein
MSRFFDDDRMVDSGAIQAQLDAQSGTRFSGPELGTNGGISNEYYLNDYKNRMPFHYVEEGDDGYYYWHYGATMVIELEIEDLSLAITDDTPPYVVKVKKNGVDITDTNMVVDILLGSMADRDADDYYTRQQVQDMVNALWASLNAKSTSIQNSVINVANQLNEHTESLNRLNGDLYNEQTPVYLMDKLVPGRNTLISKAPQLPKLVIDSKSTRQLPAIIESGAGTEEDPFIAATSQEINWDLSDTLFMFLFTHLERGGFEYRSDKPYYIQFAALNGNTIVKPFFISSNSNDAIGRLYNSVYFALNDTIADCRIGKEIEIGKSGGYIGWRYFGEPNWTNIIDISELVGPQGVPGRDAQEIELRIADGYIQWRRVEEDWHNIISLVDLKGEDGEGFSIKKLYSSYEELQADFNNEEIRIGDFVLISSDIEDPDNAKLFVKTETQYKFLTDLSGSQGIQGPQGKNVELRKTSTHIQWKLIGDLDWIDLVELSEIKGLDGVPGRDGLDAKEIELRTFDSIIQWRRVGEPNWIDLLDLSGIGGGSCHCDGDADTLDGKHASDFATAEQGAKADTALQVETDPTVPSWAKQPTKPTYTPTEIGAIPTDSLDVDASLSSNSDTKIPSQRAVRTFVIEATNGLFKSVAYDSQTGILTFIKNDNSTIAVDLPLELLVSDGYYDGVAEDLVLVLANGSELRIPVSALVNTYYGDETTISLYIDTEDNNKLKFRIVGTLKSNYDAAYTHSQTTGNPHNTTKLDIGLGNVDNVKQIPLSYLDTDSELSENSDTRVPTQKAVKSYVDSFGAALQIDWRI